MIKNSIHIHLANPENLIYFAFMLPLFALLAYQWWRRTKAVHMLAAHPSARFLVTGYSPAMNFVKTVLKSVGILAVFFMLLRPQWDKKEEMIELHGRDLFIALDISRSMLCADVNPNRLEFAKKKIKDLVHKLSCERIGLLLFAGSPFVACPLTQDYDSFFMFLSAVDQQTISCGGTAIDKAIRAALDIYKKMPDRKHKLLILFTDGEDFSTSMNELKKEAAQTGMHIFAFGLGTNDGGPIPLFDQKGSLNGHQKDKNGAVVISRLDETLLTDLVNSCGGNYIKATEDRTDIQQVLNYLEQYEKEKIEEKKKEMYQEKYHYFAAVSFICFIIAWLL